MATLAGGRSNALPAVALHTMLMMGIPSPDLAELAIECGVQTIIADAEHGFSLGRDLRELLYACRAATGRCLVRIAPSQVHHIGVLADLGVHGVVLSSVRSRRELATALSSARFPPAGTRSTNPFVPAARRPGDLGHLRETAEQFEIWAMAETTELLVDLHGLTEPRAAPWSGAIIGPYDLAASLGCPAEPESEILRQAVGDYIACLTDSGTPWALFVRDISMLERWIAVGVQPAAVVIGYDRDLWADACRNRVQSFNRQIEPNRRAEPNRPIEPNRQIEQGLT